MEKKHIFTGAATAIVTPMNDSGVDYEALGKLIDWQIASGISAIVVCATTGEAPTLTDNELGSGHPLHRSLPDRHEC